MDQITHDIRYDNWVRIIDECQNRPKDISARQWLKENEIPEKSYYYWQRKLRNEAADNMQLPSMISHEAVAFAEIPIPTCQTQTDGAVGLLKTDRFTLQFSNRISTELLSIIIREATNA